jgi:hypothetical protein
VLLLANARSSLLHLLPKIANKGLDVMKVARAMVVPILLLAAESIFALSANADPIVWSLQGIRFDDSATATGSFTYDALTNTFTNWNISVTAGPNFTAYTYRPGVDSGFVGIHSDSQVDFVAFPPLTTGRYVRLTFLSSLTSVGGTIGLKTDHTDWECDNCSVFRYITAGAVTTTAQVPEPSSLMLVAVVLLIGGLISDKRKFRPNRKNG